MSEFQLNSRELLFLAALTGAEQLYGIPDGFFGMDDSETAREIYNLRDRLEKKGLANTDFNGNFIPDAGLISLIESCSGCERFISFEKTGKKTEPVRMMFYLNGQTAVKIEQVFEDFSLGSVEQSDIKRMILEKIDRKDSEQKSSMESVSISNDALNRIKGFAYDGFNGKAGKLAEKELQNLGCSKSLSALIYSGLAGESAYLSVTAVDFEREDDGVFGIMALNSKDGSLELLPVYVGQDDGVRFSGISQSVFEAKINGALSSVGIPVDGCDFA